MNYYSFFFSFFFLGRRLGAFLQLDKVGYFPLYLEVCDRQSLASGWRRHAKVRLSIVNQRSEELFLLKGDHFLVISSTERCQQFSFPNHCQLLYHIH